MDHRNTDHPRPGRFWQGVRMSEVAAGADPDAAARVVTLPASWGGQAASALASLAPGDGPATLPKAAAAWIRPIAARARAAGDPGIAERLQTLLLRRQGAPTIPVWQGAPHAERGGSPPGFVLNLPAFHDTQFDVAGFADAVTLAATALHLIDPEAPRLLVGMADLDGLLARLGLDYDSDAARDVAANVAALLRARTAAALAGAQPDLLCRAPDWPAPPRCTLPGLHEAALAARALAMRGAGGAPCTGMAAPGPAEALLGVETGGIAPAFSPVSPEGGLTRAAQSRLASLGITTERALAAVLAGETLLAPPSLAAHQAMHDTLAAYLHAMPPRPTALVAPPAPPRRRELPARRRGFTQRASVGGHRVTLRTGEYDDGTLGEIEILLPREGASLRASIEHLSAAVSLGLQHGVPLQDYVDGLTLGRFGPAGAVEGDGLVRHATSVLDYAFRTLAHAYLGGCSVPEATPEPDADPAPLLPMDLPPARRPALRLVASR